MGGSGRNFLEWQSISPLYLSPPDPEGGGAPSDLVGGCQRTPPPGAGGSSGRSLAPIRYHGSPLTVHGRLLRRSPLSIHRRCSPSGTALTPSRCSTAGPLTGPPSRPGPCQPRSHAPPLTDRGGGGAGGCATSSPQNRSDGGGGAMLPTGDVRRRTVVRPYHPPVL